MRTSASLLRWLPCLLLLSTAQANWLGEKLTELTVIGKEFDLLKQKSGHGWLGTCGQWENEEGLWKNRWDKDGNYESGPGVTSWWSYWFPLRIAPWYLGTGIWLIWTGLQCTIFAALGYMWHNGHSYKLLFIPLILSWSTWSCIFTDEEKSKKSLSWKNKWNSRTVPGLCMMVTIVVYLLYLNSDDNALAKGEISEDTSDIKMAQKWMGPCLCFNLALYGWLSYLIPMGKTENYYENDLINKQSYTKKVSDQKKKKSWIDRVIGWFAKMSFCFEDHTPLSIPELAKAVQGLEEEDKRETQSYGLQHGVFLLDFNSHICSAKLFFGFWTMGYIFSLFGFITEFVSHPTAILSASFGLWFLSLFLCKICCAQCDGRPSWYCSSGFTLFSLVSYLKFDGSLDYWMKKAHEVGNGEYQLFETSKGLLVTGLLMQLLCGCCLFCLVEEKEKSKHNTFNI